MDPSLQFSVDGLQKRFQAFSNQLKKTFRKSTILALSLEDNFQINVLTKLFSNQSTVYSS